MAEAASDRPKLFLLDAMALVYRAYFAFSKNPRINSKGLNTSAAFGFTNSLLEVLNKEKPGYIGVVFDLPGPTFRHETYEEYKSTRQKQPEDIATNIPYIKQITEGFNIPVLSLEGYEADDLIGTLAKKAEKEGFEVFMMTPDKDYGQLVAEHIKMYKPSYGGKGTELMGPEEVKNKWGIERVEQVIDMLALEGDSSDNIPGIAGIGSKTAQKLVAQFGSVEGLLENTAQLKGKQKEKVESGAEDARLSKKLATIVQDAPIDFDPESLKYSGFDQQKLAPVFEELEFRTLARRLFGETTSEAAGEASQLEQVDVSDPQPQLPEKWHIQNKPHDYYLLQKPEEWQFLADCLLKQEEFCFDTETDRLSAFESRLVGLAFCYVPGEAYYIPVSADWAEAQEVLAVFRPALEAGGITKIAQNIKFDATVLKNYGIRLAGPYYDTMLAHYLLYPDMRHNMDLLAESYLAYTPVPIAQLIGEKGQGQGSMAQLKPEEIAEYAAEDADITLQLKHHFAPHIRKRDHEKLLVEVEGELAKVLTEMEYWGVLLNKNALYDLSERLAAESAQVQQQIFEMAGQEFNINSPQQLGAVLFEKLKISDKPKKTRTGQYATNEETLLKLGDHEIVEQVLEYRELLKLKSTYVDVLPTLVSEKDGRIHTSYNQAVAATGRLSSNNPNLQNIPIRTERGQEIRRAFIPSGEQYTLFSADYSQIELRIMAAMSQDQSMMAAFREGQDIHTTTAAKVFQVSPEEVDRNLRSKAKTVNFGIIYGISPYGLSQRVNIPQSEAKAIIENYFQEFPAIKAYMDRCIEDCREKGYVSTLLGRRRYLPDINSRNATTRGNAERNAINTPIQGSAADMIKLAMIHIYRWMAEEGLRSKLVLQVHDELVFDAHRDELALLQEKVPAFMQSAMDLEVPIEVGTGSGENWLLAH